MFYRKVGNNPELLPCYVHREILNCSRLDTHNEKPYYPKYNNSDTSLALYSNSLPPELLACKRMRTLFVLYARILV